MQSQNPCPGTKCVICNRYTNKLKTIIAKRPASQQEQCEQMRLLLITCYQVLAVLFNYFYTPRNQQLLATTDFSLSKAARAHYAIAQEALVFAVQSFNECAARESFSKSLNKIHALRSVIFPHTGNKDFDLYIRTNSHPDYDSYKLLDASESLLLVLYKYLFNLPNRDLLENGSAYAKFMNMHNDGIFIYQKQKAICTMVIGVNAHLPIKKQKTCLGSFFHYWEEAVIEILNSRLDLVIASNAQSNIIISSSGYGSSDSLFSVRSLSATSDSSNSSTEINVPSAVASTSLRPVITDKVVEVVVPAAALIYTMPICKQKTLYLRRFLHSVVDFNKLLKMQECVLADKEVADVFNDYNNCVNMLLTSDFNSDFFKQCYKRISGLVEKKSTLDNFHNSVKVPQSKDTEKYFVVLLEILTIIYLGSNYISVFENEMAIKVAIAQEIFGIYYLTERGDIFEDFRLVEKISGNTVYYLNHRFETLIKRKCWQNILEQREVRKEKQDTLNTLNDIAEYQRILNADIIQVKQLQEAKDLEKAKGFFKRSNEKISSYDKSLQQVQEKYKLAKKNYDEKLAKLGNSNGKSISNMIIELNRELIILDKEIFKLEEIWTSGKAALSKIPYSYDEALVLEPTPYINLSSAKIDEILVELNSNKQLGEMNSFYHASLKNLRIALNNYANSKPYELREKWKKSGFIIDLYVSEPGFGAQTKSTA